MGYDLPAYRARKARLHPAMSEACSGAPLVQHDFCRPTDWPQDDRDRKFRRECLAAPRRSDRSTSCAAKPIFARAAE
ncbi:MAG: hypothetical protein ABI369_02825 [Acetobacteraceae bacterium]